MPEPQILYLNCKQCFDAGKRAGLDVITMDGDLYVICKEKEHGAVLVHPLDPRYLLPQHCAQCPK